jgi:hypothetical protein
MDPRFLWGLPQEDASCTLWGGVDLRIKYRLDAAGLDMLVELDPTLEVRLGAAAEHAALSVDQLVQRVLTDFLDEFADDPRQWVETTRKQLPQVWPDEDFAHWGPPRAD